MLGRRVLPALTLVSALLVPLDLAAQTEGDRRAAELMQDGDWVRARALLDELVASEPTATRLFNLAQAERNLGRLVDARRHFHAAERHATTQALDDVARAARDAARKLDARLARVVLVLPPGSPELVVRLDGRRVPYRANQALEVDPGTRRLHVSAAGHEPFERELALAEGQKLRVELTLGPLGRPSPRSRASSEPARSEARPRSPSALPSVPMLVLGGAGVAALAGGLVFHFVADAKDEDAARGCREDGDRFVCPQNLENDARHRELREEADGARTTRNVLFAVGAGALLAGGVWWALSPRSASSPELGVSVAPEQATARLRVPIF